MSKLLEIFGRAITVNTADLIWHWLNTVNMDNQQTAKLQNADFEKAIELLGNMDLDAAQEKLRFYLFENPDCACGRMAAAAVCLHKNDLEKAVEQLQSIYLRQPSNTMALYSLGYCNERAGRAPEAVEFYQDCLKFKNHLQLPRQRLAAIYFNNSRIDKTIREYELLTTEHPEDISSLVLLGYLYIADQQYERAADTFNMAIIAHPDNFNDDSQDEEIEELIQTGQFTQALERIQWLIESVGEMPDLNVKMADIYSRAGQSAQAITYYENALRLQPNYLEATIKLGTHYLRIGRMTLAAEQFNRAVEINDEIVDAYIGLAMAQQLDSKNEEAYRTMSLASAIQQNSTLLFSETATLNLRTTMNEQTDSPDTDPNTEILIDDVIRAHQGRITENPTNADGHYKYGILMMVVENLTEAIKSFKNALKTNPTHHRAKAKLALCLYEISDYHQAMDILTDLGPIDVETLNLHYQTAILYCDKHKFAEALCTLQNRMKDSYTDPDAVANIQLVLENLGLIDRANATWDRLTETAHHAISSRYH